MPIKEYIITVNNIVVWVKYSSQEFLAIREYLDSVEVNYTYEIKNLTK